MSARNLLHKTRVAEFQAWLTAEGIPWRGPRGDWQIMQIQLRDGQWACIYERIHMPEHVTVDKRLVPLVYAFINSTKPKPVEASIDTFDAIQPPPWD